MAEAPTVREYDWINVGNQNAVVCQVRTNGIIEVVYLDRRGRAINEDVQWKDGRWQFLKNGPSGYADRYVRLQLYVAALHAGR